MSSPATPARPERAFIPLDLAVITVSDTRTLETDGSGQRIVDGLGGAGHRVAHREIITDDLHLIRATVARFVADPAVPVVILTGGTGITRRDVTPEAVAPLATKHIPGFGELFRHLSLAEIGTSTVQSRADAWLCDTTLVFALPGSTNAVRLAVDAILLPQLDHRTRPCNFVQLMDRF